MIIKLSYSAFSIFSNVMEVVTKQQMINNDRLNHGKPQLQLWIDSLNEMFLSRWTAHEQWNITFILLKTRREEGHQFVNLIPDRHAKFVITQWITCVLPKLANLLMHSQCALSEPISSSRKTRKFTVCRFIWTSIYSDESEFIPDYI